MKNDDDFDRASPAFRYALDRVGPRRDTVEPSTPETTVQPASIAVSEFDFEDDEDLNELAILTADLWDDEEEDAAWERPRYLH